MNMTMNLHTKRGAYAVEAAIFLPVFLVAVLTVGSLIRIVAADESAVHIAAAETARLAVAETAYLETKETICRQLEGVHYVYEPQTEIRYLYNAHGIRCLIRTEISWHAEVRLPIGFYDGFDRSRSLLTRAFVGTYHRDSGTAYEGADGDEPVWIFPTAGERYHKEDCPYIRVAARQVLLTPAVRRQYGVCEHCRPEGLSEGNMVYCFETSGRVYHKGSCFIVDRYVICVEKRDAVDRGYLACSKCGG